MNIYVDLESLLDIRQGILRKITHDHKDVVDYITSEKYYARSVDDFSDIVDMDVYKKELNRIDKDIIRLSTITYISKMIGKRYITQNNFNPSPDRHKLIFNLFPFEASDEEAEVLSLYLLNSLDVDIDIIPIFKDTKEIDAKYLDRLSIDEAYIYQAPVWLNNSLYDFTAFERRYEYKVYAPMLQIKNIDQSIPSLSKFNAKLPDDLFSLLELILSLKVSFNFIPVFLYSNILTSESLFDKMRNTLSHKSIAELFDLEEQDYEVDLQEIDKDR